MKVTQQKLTLWRLLPIGLLAGALAAVGTVATASIARTAGVVFEVDGERIPPSAFALWAIVGALIGVFLARLLRTRQRFTIVALIGTAVSLLPPILIPDQVSTKLALVLTHLVAAGVVIPLIGRQLGRITAGNVGEL